MMYLLPTSKQIPSLGNFHLSLVLKKIFESKRVRYILASILDLTLIVIILLSARQPAQRLVSPLASSLNSFYSIVQAKSTPETFAFVPDLAPNKFPRIHLDGLTALSFFDIPLTEDGQLNYYSKGYQSFTSSATSQLFERARYQNTKIFLTVSAFDNNIIENLLDDPSAQQRLADQAVAEIKSSNLNGITVDFEYLQNTNNNYQEKFTDFIKFLTAQIHNAVPQAQLAVVVPSSLSSNQSLYDIENLSKYSDKIFLTASDFIVPEVKNSSPSNPVFGYQENEYWTNISNLLSSLEKKVPSDKLVMERAWYGNGNNYPLYIPRNNPEPESYKQPASVRLDQNTIEKLVSGVPQKGKESARANIPLIGKALEAEGILDSNVLAYALATIEHETDETFAPIDEIGGPINARRLGYEGGSNYFGRGFIQLTHLRNYLKVGERIGMGDKLAKDPKLASAPEVAAKILAAFFKDNNVANLASAGNFVAARTPINPDYNGRSIAWLASKYGI